MINYCATTNIIYVTWNTASSTLGFHFLKEYDAPFCDGDTLSFFPTILLKYGSLRFICYAICHIHILLLIFFIYKKKIYFNLFCSYLYFLFLSNFLWFGCVVWYLDHVMNYCSFKKALFSEIMRVREKEKKIVVIYRFTSYNNKSCVEKLLMNCDICLCHLILW